MKKGAIFDLDGTLVSTNTLHLKAWKDVFKLYQITLTANEIQEQAGMKCVVFIKRVLERRKIFNLNPQILEDKKDEFVIEVLKRHPAKLFTGAEDFLKLLKANGVKLALATSASKKTALILGRNILKYFDTAIFAEDVTQGKPDPQVFLKAAEKLNLCPNDCIVFEDATNGVQAAKSGGFFCIANNNGLGQDLSSADLIIVKKYYPSDLIKLFKKDCL
jgi:beta-phosphoglucomutase